MYPWLQQKCLFSSRMFVCIRLQGNRGVYIWSGCTSPTDNHEEELYLYKNKVSCDFSWFASAKTYVNASAKHKVCSAILLICDIESGLHATTLLSPVVKSILPVKKCSKNLFLCFVGLSWNLDNNTNFSILHFIPWSANRIWLQFLKVWYYIVVWSIILASSPKVVLSQTFIVILDLHVMMFKLYRFGSSLKMKPLRSGKHSRFYSQMF